MYQYDRRASTTLTWQMGSTPMGAPVWTTKEDDHAVYDLFRVKPAKNEWPVSEWVLVYATRASRRTQWKRVHQTFRSDDDAKAFAEGMAKKPLKADLEEAEAQARADRPDVEKPLEAIRQAIRSIYGVTVRPGSVYITLSNVPSEGLTGRLRDLREAVHRAVPAQGRRNQGTPRLVIYAKGSNPYTGYEVTLAVDDQGFLVQRFPTSGEAALTDLDLDMW